MMSRGGYFLAGRADTGQRDPVADHATGPWGVLMVLFFGSYRGRGIISADGELRGNIRSVEDCN